MLLRNRNNGSAWRANTGMCRSRHINLPVKKCGVSRGGEGRNAMKLEMTNFQAVAAKLVVEGEVCEVAHAELSTQTETDTEIAPVIQKLGATSIAEIDWLMAEVRDVK